jgi:hypothetical protein
VGLPGRGNPAPPKDNFTFFLTCGKIDASITLICWSPNFVKEIDDSHNQHQEVKEMKSKIFLSEMALAASLLLILAGGCASSSSSSMGQGPSAVGTANEMSPVAPSEARNVRKVGNQWLCEVNGHTMVYNDATGNWEPKP